MQPCSPARVTKVSVAANIVLVLMAMMLPVCHLHPLLDKAAPDHCTICVSLHAAVPVGVHAPSSVAPRLLAERVVVDVIQFHANVPHHFSPSRAPPLPAC